MIDIPTLLDLFGPGLGDDNTVEATISFIDGKLVFDLFDDRAREIGSVTIPANVLAASPEMIIKAYDPS